MAKQKINLGSGELTGDGESIRSAFDKVNENFTELYNRAENTDNQTLTLTGDILSISDGNSVDLSKYTDSTFSGDYNDLINKPSIPANVNDLGDVELTSPVNGDFLTYSDGTWINAASLNNVVAGSNISLLNNDSGYITVSALTGYATETFVTEQGFLTSFTESDPIFSASASASITTTQISNWDTAYTWGNHSIAGYLTAVPTTITADLTGSVFADDSTTLVDGVNSKIVGPVEVASDGVITFKNNIDPVTWNDGTISTNGYAYTLNFPTNQPEKTAPLLVGWNDLPYIQPFLPTDIGAQEATFGAFSRSLLLNGGDATETRLPGSVYINPGRNFNTGTYGNVFISQNGSGNIYIGQDANLNNSYDGNIYIGGTSSTTTITGTTTLQGDGFININNDAYGNDVYAGFTTDKQIFNIQAASLVGGADNGGSIILSGGNAQNSGNNGGVLIATGAGGTAGTADIDIRADGDVALFSQNGAITFEGAVNFTNATVTGLPGETVTSLQLVTNTLQYFDENGDRTDIDLSLYLDDTNLARLVSGTVDSATGIATFTRDDATTFTVDFSALFDDTNLTRITSGSYNPSTSTLTLSRDSDGSSVDVDLSGLSGLTLSDVTGNDATTTDEVTFTNGIVAANITGYLGDPSMVIAPTANGSVLIGKENTGGFSYNDTDDSLSIASTGTITIQGAAGSPVDIGTGTSGKVSIGSGTNTVEFISGSTVDFTGTTLVGVVDTETDPVVGAINGIVKSDGAGNISMAIPGTDYSTFDGAFSSLSGTPTTLSGYGITDAVKSDASFIEIGTTSSTNVGISIGTNDNQTDIYGTVKFVGTVDKVHHPVSVIGVSTPTYNFDFVNSEVQVVATVSNDFIANFTNLGLGEREYTEVKIFMVQQATPYDITDVTIDGAGTVNLYWLGGTPPTGTAMSLELYTFKIFREVDLGGSSTYFVSGQVEVYQ